jgi:hypothetical protein
LGKIINILRVEYIHLDENMSLNWREWSKNDLIYGIIAPILVILLIVGLSEANSIFGGFNSSTGGIITGLVMELEQLTVIVAIPLILGLVWNRWAGGASGFLMGVFYAFYWARSVHGQGSGILLLAYVLSPMLIGYIAGALNRNSDNFKRMVIAGVISTAIGGIALFGIFQLSPMNVVKGVDGFLLNVLPSMLCGVIVPIIAKVFYWYGIGVSKKPSIS